jgi:hypothetical protein
MAGNSLGSLSFPQQSLLQLLSTLQEKFPATSSRVEGLSADPSLANSPPRE